MRRMHNSDSGEAESSNLLESPSEGSLLNSANRHQRIWLGNKRLLILTAFSGIAGYLFGYDTANISGALPYIEDELLKNYKPNPYRLHVIEGLIVSGAVIGAAIGSALGGIFSDRFGRKIALKTADILFIVGAVQMAFAHSALFLISGRVLVGFGIGLASVTAPVYIAETAPSQIRATLVTFNTLMITFGQLIAYFASFLFTYTQHTWRWMLGIAAVPAVIQIIGLSFLPESPRWLQSKGRDLEAKRILSSLSHPSDQKELEEVTDETERKLPLLELFKSKAIQKELHIGVGLQIWQQLCGINTVMYYTPAILQLAGVTNNRAALLIAMIPAAVNALGTVLGMYLVDHIGRRKLLLGSLFGIVISLILLGTSFQLSQNHAVPVSQDSCTTKNITTCAACVQNGCKFCPGEQDGILNNTCISSSSNCPGSAKSEGESCQNSYFLPIIISVVLYLAAFSPGMGTVPWSVNAEIFPIKVRGLANGASATANWITNAIVSQLFLTLADYMGASGVFWLLASIAILSAIWVYIFLPETKGLSLQAIQNLFADEEKTAEENETEVEPLYGNQPLSA